MLSMAFLFSRTMIPNFAMAYFFRRRKMIIGMKKDAAEDQVEQAIKWVESLG